MINELNIIWLNEFNVIYVDLHPNFSIKSHLFEYVLFEQHIVIVFFTFLIDIFFVDKKLPAPTPIPTIYDVTIAKKIVLEDNCFDDINSPK